MTSESDQQQVSRATRTMQIIVAAIGGGTLFFALVAMIIVGDAAAKEQQLLTLLGIGFAVVSLLLAVVIAPFMGLAAQGAQEEQQGGEQGQAGAVTGEDAQLGRWLGLYQTRLIFQCALMEGAAFFNLIAYIIEHRIISVLVAAALMVAIFQKFPTLGRVQRWIEKQQETNS